MSNKKKSLLTLLITVLSIALMSYILAVGVGKWNRGQFKNIILGLDLQGGVSITYEAAGNVTAEEMQDVLEKLKDRAENFSTESDVYLEGEKRVVVDIPGADDAQKVLKSLGADGNVEFKDESGQVLLTGADIESAKATTQTTQQSSIAENVIQLKLNSAGTKKFADATKANLGKTIGIYYDGECISAPTVNDVITSGEAVINGMESFEKADEIATFIRIGALPTELKEIRSNVVGAKLGDEAIKTSLIAAVIGIALILVFMLAMYRVSGLAADIALILYTGMVLLLLNGLNITLTLPGVAGIILSIGMAVDANVIIFTRIKEEIALGKAVDSAIKSGFSKAASAIIDGNVTTLIAAAVLALKGSGTVKGFAYTLAIGIIVSMFTALIVTRSILNMLYNFGLKDAKFYGKQKEIKTINFVKHRFKYIIISSVLIIAGIGMMIFNKTSIDGIFAYGLDFKGGTSMTVQFAEDSELPANDTVAKIFTDNLGVSVDVTPIKEANQIIIKSSELSEEQRDKADSLLKKDVKATEITYESISATVSDEMRSDAITAVILATIAMLIYIWIRFKGFSSGLSSIIALVHDVLIVLGVYALTRIEVGNTFIACMLTIVGYSINNTIVVFDRIRENRAEKTKNETLADVVNKSITQTVSRSIYTSLTTFVMVLVMYIIGVESIKDFTLPLMAGLLAGTFSSVCLAGTVWYMIYSKFGKPEKQNTRYIPKKNSDGAVV